MKTLLVYSELSGFAIQIKNHIYDALQDLQIETRECYIDDVQKVSEEFQPTMHIFLHHQYKLYEKLEVIKNLKGHKLLWTMEDPYESDVTFDMAPYFYYIFTSDQNTAEALKKEFPTNSIHYVPHACNPKVHKKIPVTWEYKSDICFIGNAYESRLSYFQSHAEEWEKQLVTLIGVGYRGLDGYQSQHLYHGHINEEDTVKYINGAKIALNLHRLNSDLDMANKRNIEPKHLNNRFYEITAMGAMQVVEGRDEMQEEMLKVQSQQPEEYSYKARLKEYYLPLLKK
jgi:spore maturation protein CgeB